MLYLKHVAVFLLCIAISAGFGFSVGVTSSAVPQGLGYSYEVKLAVFRTAGIISFIPMFLLTNYLSYRDSERGVL